MSPLAFDLFGVLSNVIIYPVRLSRAGSKRTKVLHPFFQSEDYLISFENTHPIKMVQ
jgi:hypothetical protein